MEAQLENKRITIVKVVSRNFIWDFVTSIQNILGFNLTAYEKMIGKAQKQIEEEITKRNLIFSWYRYQITQMTNGSIAIMLYGDLK